MKLNGLHLRRCRRYGLLGVGWSLLLLLCLSCSEGLNKPEPSEKEGEQIVRLTIACEAMSGERGSTAVSENTALELSSGSLVDISTRSINEEKISNLCVFQFSGSAGTSKSKLLKSAYMSSFSPVDGNTVEFSSSPSPECFFYVCTNVGDITDNFTADISTFDDLRKASLTISGQDDFSDQLPMSGLSSTINMHTQSRDILVSLECLVAKVTFTCDLSAFPSGSTFVITGAILRNVPVSVTYVAPDSGLTTTTQSTYYTSTGNTDTGSKITTYVWYMPENLRGTGTGITYWRERILANAPSYATYIELTGIYTPEGGTGIAATYTIYLGDGVNMNNYDVARNHHYIVTSHIKGIDMNDPRMVLG